MVALDGNRIGIPPNLAPIGQPKTTQGILLPLAVVVHDIDPAVQDSRPGIPVAKVDGPQFGGSRGGPGVEQGLRLPADAVPVGASKLRPRARQLGGLGVRRRRFLRTDPALTAGANQLPGKDRVGLGARRVRQAGPFPARAAPGTCSDRATTRRQAAPSPTTPAAPGRSRAALEDKSLVHYCGTLVPETELQVELIRSPRGQAVARLLTSSPTRIIAFAGRRR